MIASTIWHTRSSSLHLVPSACIPNGDSPSPCKFWHCNILVSKLLGFETFPCFFMVSVSVSKKNWYRKKYRYRFRKFLVSEKVSVLVSKKFGIEKSIGIGIGKKLVSKKVSVSVSKKIGIGKKFRIRFRSDFGFRHTLLPRNISRTRSLLLIGCVVSTEILCHIQGHFSILLSQWQLCQNNCCNGIQLLHF